MKKLTGLILALLCAIAVVFPAAAAEFPVEITGPGDAFGTAKGTLTTQGIERSVLGLWELGALGKVWPGAEIFIPLRTKDFAWSKDGGKPPMTPTIVRQLDMKLWYDQDEISKSLFESIFKSFEIAYLNDSVGIHVVFADAYDFIESMPFDFTAGISIGGHVDEDLEFPVRGSLGNRLRHLQYARTPVKLEAGVYVEMTEDREETALFDLGDGITATAKVEYGDKIYARTDTAADSDDRALMTRCPDITTARHLYSDGLAGAVNLGLPGIYVYDKNLRLLGTGEQELPVTDVYYLSPKRLTK